MSRTSCALALSIFAIAAAAPPAFASAGGAGTRYYVSLGDSYAQGFQPIGGPPSPLGLAGYNHGYADQLSKLVRDRYDNPRLVKLGCGGETTTTMIVGSPWCGYAMGSQLAAATAFLATHRGQIAFVTIDIGGNDVISPDGGGIEAVVANLPTILARLRDAVGPGVPIVGMNYFHPFLPDVWFATHDADALQGSVDAILGFDDVLESLYAAAGDPVADVAAAFATTAVGDADSDGVPDNVERICAWTWRCAPPPHGPDIHPNDAGYGAVARAFADVIS